MKNRRLFIIVLILLVLIGAVIYSNFFDRTNEISSEAENSDFLGVYEENVMEMHDAPLNDSNKSCDIISADWTATEVYDGTKVKLNNIRTDCKGYKFKYTIYENNSKKRINYYKESRPILWKTKNYRDQNVSWYYFNISVIGNESESVQSGLLKVVRQNSSVNNSVNSSIPTIPSQNKTCDLSSANWNITNTYNGTNVKLLVDGKDCDQSTFNYNIYEKNSKSLIVSVDSKDELFIWKTETYLNQNTSFYYANVSVVGNETESVKSDLLNVTKVVNNIPVLNQSGHCLEVIPGHNNINDPYRQNVVVVGFNQNLSTFLASKDYIYSVDGSQTPGDKYRGIFNFEPYKSNKDAFNLWYVDVVGTFDSTKMSINVWNTRDEAVKQLVEPYCKGKFATNKVIIISDIPSNTRSGATRTTPLSSNNPGLFLGHNAGAPLGSVAAHEFTHAFGGLPDYYSGSDSYYYPEGFIGQYWKYSNSTSYTIVPTTFEDCANWAPFSDMIGTGSKDGTSFLNTTCVSVSVYNSVTRQNEKIWRPYQNSLMSGVNIYSSRTDPRGIDPEFIGPSFIRTICYRMKTAMNGREEGYCADICPAGETLNLTLQKTPFNIGGPNNYYYAQKYSCVKK
ncbi:MAG: hypothetical protein Q7S56_02130 [Nanoarchaeota archaeon]|nr:hypothetical protein [Nanoarchaeota archaeon]